MSEPSTIVTGSGVAYLVGTILGLPIWLIVLLILGGGVAWIVIIPILVAAYRKQIKKAATAIAEQRLSVERQHNQQRIVRELLEEFEDPVVQIPNDQSIEGATFLWTNKAARVEWQRSAHELTSVPFDSFLVEDDLDKTLEYVRAVDEHGDAASGVVNRYTIGDGDGPPQQWRRIGDTGFWTARLMKAEINLAKRAIEAEAKVVQADTRSLLATNGIIERGLQRIQEGHDGR